MRRLGRPPDYLSITALTAGDGVNNVLMPLLLSDAGFSAAAIGPLVALLGVASLASRFPVGAVYRLSRARWLMIVAAMVLLGNVLIWTV